MGFSEKLKIGEIKIVEPRDRQEWMTELLRIILDSGNGGRTHTKVKEKDLPKKDENRPLERVSFIYSLFIIMNFAIYIRGRLHCLRKCLNVCISHSIPLAIRVCGVSYDVCIMSANPTILLSASIFKCLPLVP